MTRRMASPLQQLEPRRKPLFTCPRLVLGHRFYPLLVFDERPQALGRVVPQGEPMPKYMRIVKGSENHAPPPPALLEGIDKLIKDAGKRMVGVGGLLPSGNGARARLGPRGGDPGDDGMRTSSPPILPRSSSGVSSWRTILRITVLTVSAAPTAARQSSVSQKLREIPKTTVAAP